MVESAAALLVLLIFLVSLCLLLLHDALQALQVGDEGDDVALQVGDLRVGYGVVGEVELRLSLVRVGEVGEFVHRLFGEDAAEVDEGHPRLQVGRGQEAAHRGCGGGRAAGHYEGCEVQGREQRMQWW